MKSDEFVSTVEHQRHIEHHANTPETKEAWLLERAMKRQRAWGRVTISIWVLAVITTVAVYFLVRR